MSLIFGPGADTEEQGNMAEVMPAAAPDRAFYDPPRKSERDDHVNSEDLAGMALTGLDEADLRRLEGMLIELSECERILHLARRS
jgi:hypothetical protein